MKTRIIEVKSIKDSLISNIKQLKVNWYMKINSNNEKANLKLKRNLGCAKLMFQLLIFLLVKLNK